MAVCKEVRTWITQNVLIPVVEFTTELKEKCEEVGHWVDTQVSQPEERWVSKQEEHCKEMAWWNPIRWLCELVTVVVKVIVWVVVTVSKWVVTILCHLVTQLVAIIVGFVLRVIAWLVTFIVCLFTDPLEALKSFRDLWQIIIDTVEDLFDLGDILLGDALGILDDLNHLIDSVGSSLGWIGVALGPVRGVKDWLRNLLDDLRDLLGSVKDIVTGLLGLDLCKIERGFTDLGMVIVRGLLDTGFALIPALWGGWGLVGVLLAIRLLGALIAGTRDSVKTHQLEGIIVSTINNAFGEGTPRAVNAIHAVGIGAATMGLPFEADARRLFLSSRSRSLNPGDLHRKGVINLKALAGHLSDCDGNINEPDGEVVYTGTDLPVSYADIETYLDEGPGSVPEFQVFAIKRARFWNHLVTARRKGAALGVRLDWGGIGELEATSSGDVPLNALDVSPPGDAQQRDLLTRMGRATVGVDLSVLPAVSHFHYAKRPTDGSEPFGLTTWYRPPDLGPSGCTYRNRTPEWMFRWVLSHEMGHYWGLNHLDRSGNVRSFDEIMYSPKDLVVSGSALLEYLFLGGEPRFTLDDARTTWEWITTDGASLLP